jgi:hypothetical protein
MLDHIPAELRALPQWVGAGQNKIPINPRTGEVGSVMGSDTWGTFDEACRMGLPFVGFVLTQDDPYCIIDLDVKPGISATDWARHEKILNAFDSYTERSAGGLGYHIIVKGQLPAGVHRDNVEMYSSGRYMICTGNVVRDAPINDHQPLLDLMYGEMKPDETVELTEREGPLDDQQVYEMAMRAANAEKFDSLCRGVMDEYPSQSEADFALLSIIAYYTPDNEQVRRLFRYSALGRREKAIRNDVYLDRALSKIRAKQPPPVDMTGLLENVKQVEPEPPMTTVPPDDTVVFPPGLVGELAAYFQRTAIRPVPEIALAAAIALVAGVAGRSYNISGSGLNQYLILLARTGSGKEGALGGIENLISAVRGQVPMVDQFIGPAAFASGQALVKVLNEKPCFVSVLGEFGLTLQQLSDHRANSAQLMLRKVLLDLYAKSGWNRMLRSSVYSDTEKNTRIVQGPNVTILGESTPETFFDNLDASHVAEGLIPRFSVLEYTGGRVPRNRNANVPPDPGLAQRFIDLVVVSLTTANNGACCNVELDSESLDMLDAFDQQADAIMNASRAEVEVQVWNRAHLKALKLAALLAVGVNHHRPTVTADLARWAIAFVTREVSLVAARFKDGDVGQGDSKQLHDLRRAIEVYYNGITPAQFAKYAPLHRAGIVPYAFVLQRCAAMSSFKHDKQGATNSIKRGLQAMVEAGMLVEIARPVLSSKYAFSGVAYAISANWTR